MSKELEKAIIKIEENIISKMEQMVIMARETTTPSLTPLLNDIHKDIDAIKTEFREHKDVHESDVKAINEKLDPVLRSVSGITWLYGTFLKIGGLILLVFAIFKGYHEIK